MPAVKMKGPPVNTAAQVLATLRKLVRPDKAVFLPKFFQAMPGGYGEGDQFLGVVVPDQRKTAKQFRELPLSENQQLLDSPWHECRLTGLFVLVDQFERAAKATSKRDDTHAAREYVDFYLRNLSAVNNWDLVDSSSPKILGRWLLAHPRERKILTKLSASESVWERRVAVLATQPLIQAAQFNEILRLSKRLLGDQHDLMHKAIGWMLREMGEQDANVLTNFLQQHVHRMPRTMLRYAIEKRAPAERKFWLNIR